MTARANYILERLRNAGMTVRAKGERIEVTPKKGLPDDLRALVREHKAELVQALAARPNREALPRNFRTEPPRRDELGLPDLAERRPQVIKGRRTWRR